MHYHIGPGIQFHNPNPFWYWLWFVPFGGGFQKKKKKKVHFVQRSRDSCIVTTDTQESKLDLAG